MTRRLHTAWFRGDGNGVFVANVCLAAWHYAGRVFEVGVSVPVRTCLCLSVLIECAHSHRYREADGSIKEGGANNHNFLPDDGDKVCTCARRCRALKQFCRPAHHSAQRHFKSALFASDHEGCCQRTKGYFKTIFFCEFCFFCFAEFCSPLFITRCWNRFLARGRLSLTCSSRLFKRANLRSAPSYKLHRN